MLRHPCIIVTACLVALLSACASHDRADSGYVFAYLKTGPTSATNSPQQKQEIFEGHMANMKRLGAERRLLIAGPFAKPADPTWRGLFVLDTPSVNEAQALVATDPGVQSGEFVAECHPLRASARLREFYDIYKVEDAKRAAAPPDPTQPRVVRPYVIVTTSDAASAEHEIRRSGLAERVIWWGRLPADRAHGGVYVVDASEPDEVRDKLGDGPWVVDGWWSDKLLVKMPRVPIE